MEEYAQRHLTYAYDKFIAISGVAHALYTHFQDENGPDCNLRYLAGMWSTNLEQQLRWYVLPHT